MKHVEYIKATPLLIDTLLEAHVKTHQYFKDGYNQYAVSFDGNHLEQVKVAVNNSKARFHKVGVNRWRFYSMEVWTDLRGEPRTKSSYGHLEESIIKQSRDTLCCGSPLSAHTFKDGQTIKLCRVCGVHFTTMFELPLRSNDRHRREVLCGVNG